jgi:hypothetical protein
MLIMQRKKASPMRNRVAAGSPAPPKSEKPAIPVYYVNVLMFMVSSPHEIRMTLLLK